MRFTGGRQATMYEANVSVSHEGATTTIAAGGELTYGNTENLKRCLREATEADADLVVDFRTAVFIDSAILQYLANAATKLRPKGRKLRVVVLEVSQPLYSLTVAGFGELMEIATEPAPEKAGP